MSEEFNFELSSMSGVDATVFIDGEKLGTLQAISFTSQREVSFNYVLGNVNPVSVAKGKRGSGGSLVFLDFHRDAFDKVMKNKYAFQSVKDANLIAILTGLENKKPSRKETEDFVVVFDGRIHMSELAGFYEVNNPDQLPLFNICIINQNEQGYVSRRYVLGCSIVNQGSSISVDDINVSSTYTYIALAVTPWQVVATGVGQTAAQLEKWMVDFGAKST